MVQASHLSNSEHTGCLKWGLHSGLMREIQPVLAVDFQELAHANFLSSFFCQFSQDCHMCYTCIAIGTFIIELALTPSKQNS